MNFSSINDIRELMTKHGIAFSKSLGQNFLVNDGICEKIADASLADKNTNVIEIGPGIGTLTRKLAERAKKVVAIEIDKGLIPVLEDTLEEYDNIKVVNEDVMQVDFTALMDNEFNGERTVVCSNLPYYITSPLIMKLLSGTTKRGKTDIEQKPKVENITLLLQKEAATRVCAKMGTRQVGAISVAVNYYSEPEMLFGVSRGSFAPAPNVDSLVIRLKLRDVPAVQVKDEALFFNVIKASFSQRRKTINNSLSSGLGINKQKISEYLIDANIGTNVRAENLSMQDFGNIANEIAKGEKR